MKSKISFFNKTIFFKNITLYWPIWTAYLIFLIITGPIPMALEFNLLGKKHTAEDALWVVSEYLLGNVILVSSFIVAIVVAMALHQYLYVSKNANMIHSLPFSRTELFVTNLLSGFAFMFIPQIITFFLNVFVCLANGMTAVEYLAMWLLVSMGESFLFYSIAVFSALLTGQLFVLPLYYIGFNFLFPFLQFLVALVFEFCSFGMQMDQIISVTPFSPALFLWDNVWFEQTYQYIEATNTWKGTGLALQGGVYVALYLIPAVILLVIPYLFYRKRQIEQAGDWVTVNWLKPVFRWGIGLAAGYFFGVCLAVLFANFEIYISDVGLFFFILLFGIVFFFISEMFLQKNFKVFQKKRVAEMGIFAVALLMSYLGVQGGIHLMEQYIPEEEDILYATIDVRYSLDLEGEEISDLIAIHKEILDNQDAFDQKEYYYVSDLYVPITYYLKNGHVVERRYDLCVDEITAHIDQKILDKELEANHYMKYLFGYSYDEAEVYGGFVEYAGIKNDEWNWYSHDFTVEEAQLLYEAAMEDAKDGNLQKYNVLYEYYEYSSYDLKLTEEERNPLLKEKYAMSFYLQYNVPENFQAKPKTESGVFYSTEYEMVEYINSCNISVGKDCRNIIEALISIGVIESEEELFTEWEEKEKNEAEYEEDYEKEYVDEIIY